MTSGPTLMGAAAAAALVPGATGAFARTSAIRVACLMDRPLPFRVARHDGGYGSAPGVDIDWVASDTGTAMSAAMASGDARISVGQGVPPFVATSALPAPEEQLGRMQSGGSAAPFMKGVADVSVAANSIPAALETCADAVDTGPPAAAAK